MNDGPWAEKAQERFENTQEIRDVVYQVAD
jgi:hypothetical protein